MRIQRLFVRCLLAGGGLVAASVITVALRQAGGLSPNTWSTIAAALAVIAAVVSAWTSQRVIELQEDALEPHVVISFDARSRYQLVQLRLVNSGQSPAHGIKVEWQNAPTDSNGNAISFGSAGVLPVLIPGERASRPVDVAHGFFARYPDTTFAGRLTFANASGELHSQDFLLSAEHERDSLLHDDEGPKTQYELQKLPDKLAAIAKEIRDLHRNA